MKERMPTILEVLKSVERRVGEIAGQDDPRSGDLFHALQPIHWLINLLEMEKTTKEGENQ